MLCYDWSNNIRHECVPQEILIVAVKPGSPCCFSWHWRMNVQGRFLSLVCLFFKRSLGAVLCCELWAHTRTAPLWDHFTFLCSPSASGWEIDQHCDLPSSSLCLLKLLLPIHLLIMNTFASNIDFALTGHRQSSLGVHISYEPITRQSGYQIDCTKIYSIVGGLLVPFLQ